MEGNVKSINTGVKEQLNDIEFVDGKALIVGENGTVIFRDSKGKFKEIETGYTGDLYTEVHFQNTYFAGGEDGLLASKDGKMGKKLKGNTIISM